MNFKRINIDSKIDQQHNMIFTEIFTEVIRFCHGKLWKRGYVMWCLSVRLSRLWILSKYIYLQNLLTIG